MLDFFKKLLILLIIKISLHLVPLTIKKNVITSKLYVHKHSLLSIGMWVQFNSSNAYMVHYFFATVYSPALFLYTPCPQCNFCQPESLPFFSNLPSYCYCHWLQTGSTLNTRTISSAMYSEHSQSMLMKQSPRGLLETKCSVILFSEYIL